MNAGRPDEWVFIDYLYTDETFGQGEIIRRWKAQCDIRDLGVVNRHNGKVVISAEIVFVDPQPVLMRVHQGAMA